MKYIVIILILILFNGIGLLTVSISMYGKESNKQTAFLPDQKLIEPVNNIIEYKAQASVKNQL